MTKESPPVSSNFFVAHHDEENFFHLLSKLPVGISIYTGNQFILRFINDSALAVWGKRREEVIGKPLFEIFPELLHVDLARIMNNVHKEAERFSAKEYELSFLRNGELVTRYFDLTLDPFWSREAINEIIAIATDVTNEVVSRKKLKESEERFRSLANEAPLLVWVTDQKLQTTYINKTGLDYFALDERIDLATLSWKKFIHPDDIEKVLETMFDSAKQHLPYTLEMRLKNGVTGKYKWFLDKGIPRYSNETFTGFIGTSLDIQDRKEAETILANKVKERTEELNHQNKLLKKQNELIKKIIDSSLDLIAVYDIDTRIISINQSALSVFGQKEEDVLGKKLLEAFPQFANTKSNDDLLRALNGETVHNENYQSPVTGRYYENFLVPLHTEDNKIYAVLAIAHDNTSLINKNKQLIEAQQIAQMGNWEWNMGKDEVIWSDEMYRIYGYGEERFPVTTKKATERMLPGEFDRVRERMKIHVEEAISKHKQTGTLVYNNRPFEYSLVLPNGQKKLLRGIGKIILSPDGTVSNIVGTVQDITDQKKAEEKILMQLEELKKLNEADKLKSDFIKMASHELKTPVTSIKGYVQLLLSALAHDGEEKKLSPLLIKSSLVSIDKQVARLTRLMSELLDLSKIESGMLELNKELFSLNEVVIESVQDILYTHSKHHINVFHDFACYVYGDKDRIGQVLINLLSNAIKYSPRSDKVEVWVQKEKNNHVSVSIKDLGIGIDKKYHDKIFERFYRAGEKEEQTFPGFGIGLFIAKEITERHEGSIRVSSEKGKGSTFAIILPVANEQKK